MLSTDSTSFLRRRSTRGEPAHGDGGGMSRDGRHRAGRPTASPRRRGARPEARRPAGGAAQPMPERLPPTRPTDSLRVTWPTWAVTLKAERPYSSSGRSRIDHLADPHPPGPLGLGAAHRGFMISCMCSAHCAGGADRRVKIFLVPDAGSLAAVLPVQTRRPVTSRRGGALTRGRRGARPPLGPPPLPPPFFFLPS